MKLTIEDLEKIKKVIHDYVFNVLTQTTEQDYELLELYDKVDSLIEEIDKHTT